MFPHYYLCRFFNPDCPLAPFNLSLKRGNFVGARRDVLSLDKHVLSLSKWSGSYTAFFHLVLEQAKSPITKGNPSEIETKRES